jgi:chaperonin cofactor prefoldin
VQNREQAVETERNIMRAKLLLHQLSELGEDAVLYKNVGKAYICTPKLKIIARYEHDFKEHMESLEKHKNNKTALEKSIESAEDELKELIASNQAVAQQFLQNSA